MSRKKKITPSLNLLELLTGSITPLMIKWGLIFASVASLYLYVQYLRSDNLKLKQENVELIKSVEKQKLIIDNMAKDHKKIVESHKSMETLNKTLTKKLDDLNRTLNRKERGKLSLEELAARKPTLIEKKINDATRKVLECFEHITRGKLDETAFNKCDIS